MLFFGPADSGNPDDDHCIDHHHRLAGRPDFKQERLGINGKPFMIYKFRSMRLDAEENGPQWADEQDPRCTHFGQILRRTRLDELPQLYNILRGDMSFVGPRPERAYFYREFEKYIPGFSNRLLVTPGLTGYAQVNGGYSLKPEERLSTIWNTLNANPSLLTSNAS